MHVTWQKYAKKIASLLGDKLLLLEIVQMESFKPPMPQCKRTDGERDCMMTYGAESVFVYETPRMQRYVDVYKSKAIKELWICGDIGSTVQHFMGCFPSGKPIVLKEDCCKHVGGSCVWTPAWCTFGANWPGSQRDWHSLQPSFCRRRGVGKRISDSCSTMTMTVFRRNCFNFQEQQQMMIHYVNKATYILLPSDDVTQTRNQWSAHQRVPSAGTCFCLFWKNLHFSNLLGFSAFDE